MTLEKLPLLELIKHLQSLDPRLLTLPVKLLSIDSAQAERLGMKQVLALARDESLVAGFLGLETWAVVDAQKLASSVFQVFDHHSTELVLRIYHFVIHVG